MFWESPATQLATVAGNVRRSLGFAGNAGVRTQPCNPAGAGIVGREQVALLADPPRLIDSMVSGN
jgi:hypothetical protein